MPGELEVDKRGAAIVHYEQVGLFRKIIVHDTASMQLAQQASRAFEVVRIRRSANMHRRTADETARELIPTRRKDLRNIAEAFEGQQYSCFSPHQRIGEPSQPPAR